MNTILEKRRLGKEPAVASDTGSLASADRLVVGQVLHSPKIEDQWIEAEKAAAAFDLPETTSGINAGDRRALFYLVTALRPRSVLEIGTSVGASMTHVSLALKRLGESGEVDAVSLTTVDVRDVNDPHTKPWLRSGSAYSPREIVNGLGCEDFVTFVNDTAANYLSRSQSRFDFVFVDGSHAAATVYREMPTVLSSLNDGGVVLLHDYFPGLRPLWPNGRVIAGPYLATERLKSEGTDLKVLPLGQLPWATKQGTNVTSLALLAKG